MEPNPTDNEVIVIGFVDSIEFIIEDNETSLSIIIELITS